MHNARVKTAAVVETKWWGHHPSYMKMMVRTFVELGAEVFCACPFPEEIREWVLGDSTLRGKVWCVKVPDHHFLFQLESDMKKRNLHGANLIRWAVVRLALERLRLKTGKPLDLVFLNTLDDYLHTSWLNGLLDLVMPYPWAGLVLFLQLPEAGLGPWGLPPKRIETENCRGIFLLQENALSHMSRAVGRPCEPFPDFTDTSTHSADEPCLAVRQLKKAARGRNVVGLYGVLDKRKGIHLLLKCAAKMKNDPILFAVIGAGTASRTDPDLVSFENEIRTVAYPNIYFSRGKIPAETDFNGLVEASSALWMVYPNWPYSSNILTKAAYWKKPVIAAKGELLAERVHRFGLGVTVDADDIDSSVEAIRSVCLEKNVSEGGCGFVDYYEQNAKEKLRDVLSGLLNAEDSRPRTTKQRLQKMVRMVRQFKLTKSNR